TALSSRGCCRRGAIGRPNGRQEGGQSSCRRATDGCRRSPPARSPPPDGARSPSARRAHPTTAEGAPWLLLLVGILLGRGVRFPGLADLLRPVLVVRPGIQVATDGGMTTAAALHACRPFGIQLGAAGTWAFAS